MWPILTGTSLPEVLRLAALPFTLRQAYPWLAVASGALGLLVTVFLILIRTARRGRPR